MYTQPMHGQHRNRLLVALGSLVLIAAALLFAAFVWPSRYWYDKVGQWPMRVDRFSGSASRLTSSGWIELKPSVPQPDPIDLLIEIDLLREELKRLKSVGAVGDDSPNGKPQPK